MARIFVREVTVEITVEGKDGLAWKQTTTFDYEQTTLYPTIGSSIDSDVSNRVKAMFGRKARYFSYKLIDGTSYFYDPEKDE